MTFSEVKRPNFGAKFPVPILPLDGIFPSDYVRRPLNRPGSSSAKFGGCFSCSFAN
jgi:hypothetical protein